MIIVYGGCFNPVTTAHEKIIREISHFDYIDKVLIVPVGDKYNKAGLIESNHRVKMLNLAIKDIEKTSLNLIEILADKVLVTYETLKLLSLQYPNKKIYFLLGADNLAEFSTWDNASDILNEFGLFVIGRDDFNIDSIIEKDDILLKNKAHIIVENIHTPLNISSSNVRNHFSNIKKTNLDTHLNTDVLNYINLNSLYCLSN